MRWVDNDWCFRKCGRRMDVHMCRIFPKADQVFVRSDQPWQAVLPPSRLCTSLHTFPPHPPPQWYHKLDRIALRYCKAGTLGFVALKVLLDTAIFSPAHILGYFGVMNLGEGGSWQDLDRKVRTDFVPTLAAELAVWPAIQAANFKLVKVQYQLLVVNLLTILGKAI